MRIAERDGRIVVVDDAGAVKAAFMKGSRRAQLVAAAQYVAAADPAMGPGMMEDDTVDPIAGPTVIDGLTDRQLALRDAYEQIEDGFGQWNQTAGADGAHYAADNPFAAGGLTCSNCTFWQPGLDDQGRVDPRAKTGSCGIVAGDIEPAAICKLWIIPADRIKQTAAWTPPWKKDDDEEAVCKKKAAEQDYCDDAECAACKRNKAGKKKARADMGPGMTGPGMDQVDPDVLDLANQLLQRLGLPPYDPTAAAPSILAAGLVVRAADTGRILALQRALDPTGLDEHAGTWEFPGGKLEPGETPADTAVREWQEEVGVNLPAGTTPNDGWISGVYQGLLAVIANEADVDINLPTADRVVVDADGDLCETVAWWNPEDFCALPSLRGELAASVEVWGPLVCGGAEGEVEGPELDDDMGTDPMGMGPCDDEECAGACKKRAGVAKVTARAAGPEPAPGLTDRARAIPSSFTLEVAGRTIVTTLADTGLGYWESTPPGGGEYMSWLQGRYVGAERPNRNGALWETSDLQHGFPTVAYGPLNYLHEERRVIGSIVDAKLVPGTGMNGDVRAEAAETIDPHIAVLAGAWRWIYPAEVYSMQAAADSGILALSMECVADEVQCAGDDGCGQSFPYDRFIAGDSCAHLKQRGSVKRMVRPTFLGAGVIVPPARPGWPDADARMMAIDLAEGAYAQAGSPDVPTSQWETLVAQVVRYASW
jgi:8-oxo-dGTP pyrophosphatase MutT (NUDIX family)